MRRKRSRKKIIKIFNLKYKAGESDVEYVNDVFKKMDAIESEL